MIFDFAMISAGAALLLAWRKPKTEYWRAMAFLYGMCSLLVGGGDLIRRVVEAMYGK